MSRVRRVAQINANLTNHQTTHKRVVNKFFRILTDLAKKKGLFAADRRPAIKRTVQLAREMFKNSSGDPFFKQERRQYIKDISAKMSLCRRMSGDSGQRKRNGRRTVKPDK